MGAVLWIRVRGRGLADGRGGLCFPLGQVHGQVHGLVPEKGVGGSVVSYLERGRVHGLVPEEGEG